MDRGAELGIGAVQYIRNAMIASVGSMRRDGTDDDGPQGRTEDSTTRNRTGMLYETLRGHRQP